MQQKIHYGILSFLYIFIVTLVIVLLYTHSDNMLIMSLLLFSFILTFTLRNFLFYQNELSRKPRKYLSIGIVATIISEIMIVTILSMLLHSLMSVFLLLIVYIDLLLHVSKGKKIVMGLIFYSYVCLLYVVLMYKFEMRILLISFLIFTAMYIIVSIIISMVNYMIRQNEIIDSAYKNMSIKNMELEKLYQSLKQAYEELEEITIIKERHRVARELHDTIGHTVTKALITVEATKVLMESNPTQALERLMITEESLRDGLRDIRSILHLLDQEMKDKSLLEEVEELIHGVCEQTGVHVEVEITDLPKNSQKMQKHLLRILQEGLTNGLKHGKATAFFFKLTHDGKEVQFLLSDNGTGAALLHKGFGLLNMAERVRELRGTLHIDTAQGEGFTLNIRFPLIRRDENEQNSHFAH